MPDDLPDAPSPTVAVLGATGLVGRKILEQLELRSFPIGELKPLASARGGTRTVPFRGEQVPVQEACARAFEGVDLVLASAGAAVSRALLPAAQEAGAFCVDNSSAYRMDPEVPLVVPEVNAALVHGAGVLLAANPNCSTIQLAVALAPLHRAAGVKRVVVSTYQSASGAGGAAKRELLEGTAAGMLGDTTEAERFPRPLAFDALPQIGDFDEEGISVEERKMMQELPKILGSEIAVDVCCVRVPTLSGHGESVLVETERPLSLQEAADILRDAPGVELAEDGDYRTPGECEDRDEVCVSRLRRSHTFENGLQFWVAADNILKGAALNAVQVAEARFLTPAAPEQEPQPAGR